MLEIILRSSGLDPEVGVVSGIFQSFWDAPGGSSEEFREIDVFCGWRILVR